MGCGQHEMERTTKTLEPWTRTCFLGGAIYVWYHWIWCRDQRRCEPIVGKTEATVNQLRSQLGTTRIARVVLQVWVVCCLTDLTLYCFLTTMISWYTITSLIIFLSISMCFILELHPSFCTCFEGISLPWISIPTFHEQSLPMNHQRCLGSVRSKWQLQGQSTVVDKNSPGFHLSFQARLFFSRISLLNVKSFMFPFLW